jgi:outer membrane protein OmpA-like peptidoglycan-associated protein
MLLTASAAAAFPCMYGPQGLFRTVSAGTPPPGTYTFFFSALYQKAILHDNVHFVVDWAEVDTTLEIYDFEHYLDGMVELGLTVAEHIELAASMSYLVNAYQYDQVYIRRDFVGVMDVDWGPGMVRGAVKYGIRVHPFIEAGGMVWAGFPLAEALSDTVYDYDGFWDAGDLRLQVRRPFLTTGSPSWGLMGLASTAWKDFEANLNIGYSSYSQEYEDSILGYVEQSDGALDLGLGIAYNAPQAVLFAEYTLKSFLSRSGDPGYSSPSRVSAGVRLFENTGTYLDIIGEYGLTDFDRELSDPYSTGKLPIPEGVPGDWGIQIGLGFDSHMGSPAASGTGTVAGTITDASDGQPLAGMVSFPGSPVSPAPSDPVTGFFTAPVIPGTVVARAESEGYIPVSLTLVVAGGATVAADFSLEPAQPSGGQVSGTVTDASTGEALAALVTAEGGGSAQASPSGSFSLDLTEGSWTLRASFAGFADAVRTVYVTGGSTTAADFAMNRGLESGETLSFASIYFESGSAVLQPSSFPVLDEVAVLLGNSPEVNVQIVGHTDSDGSEALNQTLSDNRAGSVRTYLIQRGISSARLSTYGMGESQPVASNATSQGKAQNRRIEFRVL